MTRQQFFKRQRYIEAFYRENEQIQTLTPEQHKLVQMVSEMRHNLHSTGFNVYLGKKPESLKKFLNLKMGDFKGLPYPNTVFSILNSMETADKLSNVSNPTKSQVLSSCKSFLYEKEFVNQLLEKWIEDIDTLYGTHYTPRGDWRRKDIDEYIQKDINTIEKAYDNGNIQHVLTSMSRNEHDISGLSVDLTTKGVRHISGMYETTPFTCYMTEHGEPMNIVMHTPKQDLEPAEDVKNIIVSACRDELAKVRDVHIKPTNKVLLISMDNVLADLTGGLKDINNKIQLKDIYDALEKPAFFRTLKPIKPMIEAIKMYVKHHPDVEVFVFSTSKPDDPPSVYAQKNDWLNRYLPEISQEKRIFITPGMDKSKFIEEHPEYACTLIDSNIKSLSNFANAGGKVVYPCESNDRYVNLCPEHVFIDKPAEDILRTLEMQTGVDLADLSQSITSQIERTDEAHFDNSIAAMVDDIFTQKTGSDEDLEHMAFKLADDMGYMSVTCDNGGHCVISQYDSYCNKVNNVDYAIGVAGISTTKDAMVDFLSMYSHLKISAFVDYDELQEQAVDISDSPVRSTRPFDPNIDL